MDFRGVVALAHGLVKTSTRKQVDVTLRIAVNSTTFFKRYIEILREGVFYETGE